MSERHTEQHERELFELIEGASDALRAFRGSALARCAACAETLDAWMAMRGRLDDAGAERDETLARAATIDAPRVDLGWPPKGAVDADVSDAAGGSARIDRPTTAPRPSFQGPARLSLWLAASAAAVLATFFVWRVALREPPSRPPTPLGSDVLTLSAPEAHGDTIAFHWDAELPPHGRFVVRVLNLDARELAVSPPLTEASWRPSAETVRTWPDTLRWEVQVFDATGRLFASRREEASRP